MNTIKKHSSALFLFVVILTLFIGAFFYSRTQLITVLNQQSQTSLPSDFRALQEQGATQESVKKVLGAPVGETKQGDTTINTFTVQGSVNRHHEFYFSQGKTTFVKEIITAQNNKTVEEITGQLGDPPYVLYGPDQESGIYLYAYPTKGVAFRANLIAKEKVVFEVWYFPPSPFEMFLFTYAAGYSTTETKRDGI